ncbi:MAG: cytochrome P450 [Myxococcales bacterium]|nr:cytochrome P450 [Myxococcales bacterium]
MTIHYDPFSPEVRANPFPHYAQLRKEAPVHQLPGGLWTLSRYEECSFALRSPHLFSSSGTRLMMMGGLQSGMTADEETLREERRRTHRELGLESLLDSEEGWNENSLISLDPPQHDVVRNIVNRGFTPRQIQRLEPRIHEIAERVIDDILERGEELDLTSDFSTPLPLQVMAELLGVDPSHADDFQRWSEIVISGITGSVAVEGPETLLLTLQELATYFLEVVEDRRKNPRDDLISLLVAAEESDTLSAVETVNFATLLLAAGNETTTHLIDNAVLTLLEHPEQHEQVLADPSLVPAWVEETLRYEGPVQLAFRQATEDIEIGGHTIPEGDIAITLFGSANRDDQVFSDGERYDIHRDTQGHMGFGFGVHYCLGASLARLEATIALEALITRLPSLRRTEAELERFDSFLVRGPSSLPLRYDR